MSTPKVSMPPDFPRATDFSSNDVTEHIVNWHFHRDHNQGGQNFGMDFHAPNQSAIVDFSIHVTSEHNTKGDAAIYLIMKAISVFHMPCGVHVGHRLEPELFTAGATFEGHVTMKIVSPEKWMQQVISKLKY